MRKGYKFQASQTASVFTLKVTPLESGTGENLAQFTKYSCDLCNKIFPEKGAFYRLDINGQTWVSVPDMKKIILSSSFDPNHIDLLSEDNAMFGKPDQSLEDDAPKIVKETRSHWYRNVYWWNDGKAVGFYFIKREGVVSWPPSFGGRIDARWIP